MSRLGITGHINLTRETAELAARAIRRALSGYPAGELTGVSCLAAGADSIFAEAVLDAGGTLDVIVPAAGYREKAVRPDHADRFDELISRAASVRVLPYREPDPAAYQAASEVLVSSCDRLLAVWDGQPSAGGGGTADVVRQARSRGVPVEIIWPEGARRG